MSASNGNTSAGPSSAALPSHQNLRFLHGAVFKSGSLMNFEGEAEILCEAIFHESVTFITDKVRIFGEATYNGANDTSVLAAVPFEHLTPGDYRDWNVRLVCSKLTHFSKVDGVTKFATGEKVEFHGPVVFKGAVTLVRPVFNGDVQFAAQPDIRLLVREQE
ncbi:hypothetical protein E6O75_ATG03939 [Venturia nashicola]|uniref:Uncharacterized protein n=1 Tax=Venturia nashicola TaxID=86259 RepID=A0A4Z1PK88_9PEZI|nr:hypothetical protein E6O75_ATG03939 [Venturia nashicola]